LIVPRFRQTAVHRNRLRRRLKELWRRELQTRLPPWDVVFRTRPETYRASFGQLRQEIMSWCDTVPK
jgi:ribonuclease P protein component